jgi:hypothetical protein
MAEGQSRFQPLHEPKNVALGVGRRIPPAFPAVADDQDFALAAAIFETEPSALLAVELPWRLVALKHDGAMHLVTQFFDFRVGHVRSLRLSAGAGLIALSTSPLPCRANRELGMTQGRAERAGACAAPLAAGPALAVAIPLSFASHAKAGGRRREQEISNGRKDNACRSRSER